LLDQRIAEMIRSNSWEELYNSQAIVVGSLVEYAGISVFVVLLGFVIVAERHSRQRAETLTQEIESLAAALERSHPSCPLGKAAWILLRSHTAP
jgi:hypothetical protein